MIKSNWEQLHGQDGIVTALLNNFSKLLEVRFYLQYGDYLAESLNRFKDETFKEYHWKKQSIDWVEVSRKLDEELEELKSYEIWRHCPGREPPATPLMDDTNKAAQKLNMSPADLRWEIKTYAHRNLVVHNNTKRLVDCCNWSTLAERTCKDLATLHRVYPGRGQEQIAMRGAIKAFQKQFFLYIVQTPAKEIAFETTEWANELTRRRNQRLLSQPGTVRI